MKTLSILLAVAISVQLFAASLPAQEEAMEPEEAIEEETVEEPEPTPLLMDLEWARLACDAWNENPTLTAELAAPGWVANNGDRGYKVLQVYRTDCEASPWVELHIADQDDKALCVYGGALETDELISGVDYIMHAQTQRWQEMGAGDYGPMKGMMTGRLKFKGPKWEAMKNMGPFTSFLRLAGEVPSEATACP